MLLELQNFRCYKTCSITFHSSGTVLLTGPSGAGKTSIFKALNFALFGKEQKITTIGEKKTKVKLTFNNLTIIRTKSPNHLTVQCEDGLTLQDAAAQALINSHFGENFLLTSYVAQKSVEGFFSLTDAEKTAFLHKISVQNFPVESLKTTLKNKIKERKLKLATARSAMETIGSLAATEGLLSSPVEPKLKIAFPKGGSPEAEKISRAANIAECESLKKQLAAAEKDHENSNRDKITQQLEQTAADLLKVQSELEAGQNIYRMWEDAAKSCVVLEAEVAGFHKLQKLHNARNALDSLRSSRESEASMQKALLEEEIQRVKPLAEKYEEMSRLAEIEKAWKECEDIAARLEIQPTFEGCDELEKILKEEQAEFQTCSLKEQLEEFTSSLGTTTTRIAFITTQLQKQSLCCPSLNCRANLTMQDGKLILFDSAGKAKLQSEMTELSQKQSKLQKSILKLKSTIVENEKSLAAVHDDFKTLALLRNKLVKTKKPEISGEQLLEILNSSKIAATTLTGAVSRLKHIEEVLVTPTAAEVAAQKIVDGLQEVAKDLKVDSDCEKKLTEARVQCAELKVRCDSFRNLEKQKTALEQKISELQQKLQESPEDLKGHITELKEKIAVREAKAKKFDQRAETIAAWERQFEVWQRNNNLWTKFSKAKSDEEIASRAYATAEKLYNDLLETEHITLQSVLDSINRDLEEYTSSFFDNSLDMSLSTTKETASGEKRFLIDVKIKRNGEEVPLDSLSGGEFDRCALALFLAFNRATNSPILLLDEALSSLHGEAVEEIMDVVKEKFSDKLVLVTLHQANTGLFDHIIDVTALK